MARGNGQGVRNIPRRRNVRGRDVPATRNARGRRRHRDVDRRLRRGRRRSGPSPARLRRRRSATTRSPASGPRLTAGRELSNPTKQPADIAVRVDRVPVKVEPAARRRAGVRLLVAIVDAVQVPVDEVGRTDRTHLVLRRPGGRRIDRQLAVDQPGGRRSGTTSGTTARGRLLPRRRPVPLLFLRPAASFLRCTAGGLFSRHPTSVLFR